MPPMLMYSWAMAIWSNSSSTCWMTSGSTWGMLAISYASRSISRSVRCLNTWAACSGPTAMRNIAAFFSPVSSNLPVLLPSTANPPPLRQPNLHQPRRPPRVLAHQVRGPLPQVLAHALFFRFFARDGHQLVVHHHVHRRARRRPPEQHEQQDQQEKQPRDRGHDPRDGQRGRRLGCVRDEGRHRRG